MNFSNKAKRQNQNYLSSLFNIFGVVLFNVVPWSDRRLQFISDHHSRPLSGWTANEHHDASTSVGKSTLTEKGIHQKRLKENIWTDTSDNEFWYTISRKQESTHFPGNKIINCLKWNFKTRVWIPFFWNPILNNSAFLILK